MRQGCRHAPDRCSEERQLFLYTSSGSGQLSVWGFWKKRSLFLQRHACNRLFLKAGGKDEATAHGATWDHEETHQHCFVRSRKKAGIKMWVKEIICNPPPPEVLVTHIYLPFLDMSSSKTSVSCNSSVLFTFLKPYNTGETPISSWIEALLLIW